MENGVQEAAYDSDTDVERSLYHQELFTRVPRIVHHTRDKPRENKCDPVSLRSITGSDLIEYDAQFITHGFPAVASLLGF